MERRYALLLATVPAALVGFMVSAAPDSRPVPKPDAEVVGPPTSCIQLSQFHETRVRDDWTIDFIGGPGGPVWRNALTDRCPGLKAENGITYETSLSQLCDTDIVYVLETAGGLHRGPSCSLGKFVPVKLRK
jgi:hypothetical protein